VGAMKKFLLLLTLFGPLLAAAPALAQSDPTWTERVEPFRIAGNLYFVGTRGLSSFLFVTPEGNILLDTGINEIGPILQANIQRLGFKTSDIKILLSSHAHFDHVGGHAAMQQLTGATVMAVGEDAASLSSGVDTSALGGPGWKPVKVGRVLKDGETVTLGGTTLTAHLTPGHTKGCTTWTTTVRDGEQTSNVLLIGGTSINDGVHLVGNTRHPQISEDYARTFAFLKTQHPDIFLAQHPSMFGMDAKIARMKGGERNVFVDPKGFAAFIARQEQLYRNQLAGERRK
jgi:metallo-beta-lactamase class B